MSRTLTELAEHIAETFEDGLKTPVVVSPFVPADAQAGRGHLTWALSFTDGATFCNPAATFTLTMIAPGDHQGAQRWVADVAPRLGMIAKAVDGVPKVATAEPGLIDVDKNLFGVSVVFAPALISTGA